MRATIFSHPIIVGLIVALVVGVHTTVKQFEFQIKNNAFLLRNIFL